MQCNHYFTSDIDAQQQIFTTRYCSCSPIICAFCPPHIDFTAFTLLSMRQNQNNSAIRACARDWLQQKPCTLPRAECCPPFCNSHSTMPLTLHLSPSIPILPAHTKSLEQIPYGVIYPLPCLDRKISAPGNLPT